MTKTLTTLAFAAACFTAVGAGAQTINHETWTNGPQASRGDLGDWSAHRNVIESNNYERLLQSNAGFRQARMRKECGPITDPQLRQYCLASFGQDEPYVGSSSPRRHYSSSAGR